MDPSSSALVPRKWSFGRRLLFRFACLYFFLYLCPLLTLLWQPLVSWVGEHLLRIDVPVQITGSGDTTFNYLLLVCQLCLSLAGTVLWTMFDRTSMSYPRLGAAFCVWLRLWLAAALIAYGASKVIPTQFGPLPHDRLLQPVGTMSPMGLLWTFMAASPAYTVFSGCVELTAGLLVAWRRTTLLGALIGAAALANVVALNFCYDVPVKLYSLHLLVITLLLIAPDLPRLARLLLFNTPVDAAVHVDLVSRSGLRLAMTGVKLAVLVGITWSSLAGAWSMRNEWMTVEGEMPLSGIWQVKAVESREGVAVTATAAFRIWSRLSIAPSGWVVLYLSDGSRHSFRATTDVAGGTLSLRSPWRSEEQMALRYSSDEPGHVLIEGTLDDGRFARVRLVRADPSEQLLVMRGFHWITEYPFNR